MQKVFVMYRLAEGVTMDEYREWSTSVDQIVTPMQKAVIRFMPCEVFGSDPDGPSAIQIIEDIEVDSWDAFQEMLTSSTEMKKVVDGFERLADKDSIVTIYGERIK